MFSSYLPISSEGGDVSFQNNVPDPVTSGRELPTFKFELDKSLFEADARRPHTEQRKLAKAKIVE